jgi:hypothetical protein
MKVQENVCLSKNEKKISNVSWDMFAMINE